MLSSMGRRLRLWEPDKIYNVTSRCVDRIFAFKPNHHPKNILLRTDCSLDSLDLNNDLKPEPSAINIIGSSIGRALEKYPVPLYWFEGNISHNHNGLRPNADEPDNASKFMQCTNSLIARQVNKQWRRQGHLFTAPFRSEPILDDDALEEKLFYSLANPIKDNLIESVNHSPFFSTFRHLAYGDPLKFWYIDWQAWWTAGAAQNKKHCVKDYLKWTEFELTPLPAWQNWTVHQRQTRVRQRVREIEQQCAEERRYAEKTVFGVPALYNVDPRDRPKNLKTSGPQPLCHTANAALRRQFREQWRDFVSEYRKASLDFRSGYYEREFPEGSFRPPILKIYTSSSL